MLILRLSKMQGYFYCSFHYLWLHILTVFSYRTVIYKYMNIIPTKIFQYTSQHKLIENNNDSSQIEQYKQHISHNNKALEDRISAIELDHPQTDSLNSRDDSENVSRNKGVEQEATNHSRKSESDK